MAAASGPKPRRPLDAGDFPSSAGVAEGAGLACAGLPDFEQIDPHRFGDVFERCRAEIADLQIEPRLDVAIGILRKTDRPGLGHPLQPCGDIDAVAHEVAIAFLHDVANMDPNAVFYPAFGRHAGVALDEASLHLDRAAHRVDHAAELDDRAVPGALDDRGHDGRRWPGRSDRCGGP